MSQLFTEAARLLDVEYHQMYHFRLLLPPLLSYHLYRIYGGVCPPPSPHYNRYESNLEMSSHLKKMQNSETKPCRERGMPLRERGRPHREKRTV